MGREMDKERMVERSREMSVVVWRDGRREGDGG